jgi:pimeloyl-ACP methyl ester carboxylesterase
MNTLKLAGMVADLHGTPDHRTPLVLLHGLTFDRRIWQPALDDLANVDPERRVLVLDLPGHGDSPEQLPHTMPHLIELVRTAIDEAGLAAPVLVGHSMSGGLASLYAAEYPVRGVINIDALPELAAFAGLIQSMAAQVRGSGFAQVWSTIEHGFRNDLLPADAQRLVADNGRATQELVVSYWEELLTTPPLEQDATVEDAIRRVGAARVPYLLITGSEPPQPVLDRIVRHAPQARVETWANSGHFPHLAHRQRFAERLAATASWTVGPA